MEELIRKQDALDAFNGEITVAAARNAGRVYIYLKMVTDRIKALPPVYVPVINVGDMISRQAAIDALDCINGVEEVLRSLPSAEPTITHEQAIDYLHKTGWLQNHDRILTESKIVPSVQPERTCVNCGRTVNNGGWYADGRTRCPIEEHYALPKDGYCHLWEKRNVTDDDYPEGRADE